eukprot:1158509-Pelagomonas_calceolata.AAC.4
MRNCSVFHSKESCHWLTIMSPNKQSMHQPDSRLTPFPGFAGGSCQSCRQSSKSRPKNSG